MAWLDDEDAKELWWDMDTEGQKVFCRQKKRDHRSTADLVENGDETRVGSNDVHVAYAIGGTDIPAR